MRRQEIISLVEKERTRQDEMWGTQQGNTLPEWMTILTEEVGELAEQCLRVHFYDKANRELKEEAIQVAAVVFSILEHLDEDD